MVFVGIECDKCGCEMNVCIVFIGVFFGCFGYNLLLKECCINIMNFIVGDEVVKVDDEEEFEIEVLCLKKCCLKCGIVMDSYFVDEFCKFYVCGNILICDGILVESGIFKIKGYDGFIIECDKCGSDMEFKNGWFGKYFGCINEECKNICKLL